MYEYRARIIRVVDGDTLVAEIDLGFSTFVRQKVRLANVDTPEVYGVKKGSEEYVLGKEASSFTESFVASTSNNVIIVTNKDKQGKYGRYIATIKAVEGPYSEVNKTLNQLLVESGHSK